MRIILKNFLKMFTNLATTFFSRFLELFTLNVTPVGHTGGANWAQFTIYVLFVPIGQPITLKGDPRCIEIKKLCCLVL